MKYCGIDLAKEKFDINYFDNDGNECFKEVKNNLKGIVTFLKKLPKNISLCAEYTGSYGDLLLFLSNQCDIPIAFASGYAIKHSLGVAKGKDDQMDAKRIREYAERFEDKLSFTFYDNESMSELKELFAVRRQLVKARKQLITAQKSLIVKPMQSVHSHQSSSRVIQSLCVEIDQVEDQIQLIISTDIELNESYTLARSVIGVGPVLATQLIIKTSNFKVIDSARKAASFAGVCPFPNSSGKMVSKNKTSSLADKELKSILYMAAKSARKHNVNYCLYFEKKKNEGKPYFLIMNNISNKLLKTVYSVVLNKTPFEKNHICVDPREKTAA